MRLRRAAFLLGICAALAAGIALRLHTREQANVGGRIRPLDSDSAYHMRRARFAAANYPRTIQFDPLMNFPEGGVAIWPPLFDVVLATPAVLAEGRDASADSIERGAAWIPVLLGAGVDPARGSPRPSAAGSLGRSRGRGLSRRLPGGHSLVPVRAHRPARGRVLLRAPGAPPVPSEPRAARRAGQRPERGSRRRRARGRRADLAGRDLLGGDLRPGPRVRGGLRAPARCARGRPDAGTGRGPGGRRDGRVAGVAPPSPDVRVLRVLPAAVPRGAVRRHGRDRTGGEGGAPRPDAARARAGARRDRGRRPGDAPLRAGASSRACATASGTSRAPPPRSRGPAVTCRTRRTGSRASSRRGRSWPTARVWPCGSCRPGSSSRRSSCSSGPREPGAEPGGACTAPWPSGER